MVLEVGGIGGTWCNGLFFLLPNEGDAPQTALGIQTPSTTWVQESLFLLSGLQTQIGFFSLSLSSLLLWMDALWLIPSVRVRKEWMDEWMNEWISTSLCWIDHEFWVSESHKSINQSSCCWRWRAATSVFFLLYLESLKKMPEKLIVREEWCCEYK